MKSAIVSTVEVFIIPLAAERYELYCESATDAEPDPQPTGSGFFAKLRRRFSQMLREAEARRHGEITDVGERSWLTRAQERVMAWVVERIAEQRLLWSLRRETDVILAHPADLSFDQAHRIVERVLQRDRDRHLRWLVIDSVLALGAAALVFLPGPNFVFYYFAFRVVGHWFSKQGADQGLKRITWTGRPCAPLGELRDIGTLRGPARDERIEAISERLRLKHLATFYDRVAI